MGGWLGGRGLSLIEGIAGDIKGGTSGYKCTMVLKDWGWYDIYEMFQ